MPLLLSDCEDVLASSADNSIILVDIPRSIECAQGRPTRRILSCSPLNAPFALHEPRSAAATARLEGRSVLLGEAHATYATVLDEALDWIQGLKARSRTLCLPRVTRPGLEGKRKLEHAQQPEDEVDVAIALQLVKAAAANRSKHSSIRTLADQTRLHLTLRDRPDASKGDETAEHVSGRPWAGVISNCSLSLSTLYILDSTFERHRKESFVLPPNSCSVLGDCAWPGELKQAKNCLLAKGDASKMDLIVLDPPWPNSSVSRKKNYDTALNLESLAELLEGMNLDSQISSIGFVAMWITNKPACRKLVLGEDGLFDRWQIRLVEEWIWLKITATGDTVTPIDGLWRKPYEVLLIGQRQSSSKSSTVQDTAPSAVTQRVLVGVPDLHSRKPCIKNLSECLLLPKHATYTALEIFARYPTQGWISWGNEVLRYCSSVSWSDQSESDPA